MKQRLRARRQQGAVLVISLLMLLLTTLIGVSAMSSATMQEKMVGNMRQRQLAFQSAESALRVGERWLTSQIRTVTDFTTQFSAGGAAELYWARKPQAATAVRPVPNLNVYDAALWDNTNSLAMTQPLAAGQPAPRYRIEYLGRDGEPPVNADDPDTRRFVFEVTAIGIGTDQVSVRVVKSTYRLPLF